VDIGKYTIIVTVSDDYGENDYSFNVIVENNPPTFSGALSDTDVWLQVSKSTTISIHYSDPDGHTVSVSVNELDKVTSP
jgi:hypothetical protein